MAQKTALQCAAMTGDGEYLVAGAETGSVSVIRCSSLDLLYKFPPCDSAVRSVALSHNHRWVTVAGCRPDQRGSL